MNREFFEDYTVQGRRMVQLGLFFVFMWAAFYIIIALTLTQFRLSATIPFLVFGILCAVMGLIQKKKTKKPRKNSIKGMDELGLAILSLEMLGALIMLFYALAFKQASPMFASFVAADVIALVFSFATFNLYRLMRMGVKNFFIKYQSAILVVAILSHLFWSSLISTLV